MSMQVAQLPIPATISKYWPFRGGLDQVSPSIDVSPGLLRRSINIEVGVNGAYITSAGNYERYDGQAKPSDAVYSILACTITGTPTVGNSIAGATSGATAVIIAATAASLVLTKVVGTFQAAETVTGSGASSVVTTSVAAASSAPTAALNATYRNLAADVYRADIAAVPGSGSVLGVWKYASTVYAVRNNAGATAAAIYKNTAAGWSLVNLGRELAFTSGAAALVAGATITGATSAATAVIGTVVVTSGTLAGGTAVGFIYFTSQTGTFQAENIQVGGVNKGVIAANSTAVALTPSGRYEFINANFGGTAGSTKMYGCSGVHKAFQFDGTNFAYVTTGMTADTPRHIAAHKNHLFLAFGGSAQHSSIGDPLTWSVILGAAELAMGDTITAFQVSPGSTSSGSMIIRSRNSTKVLYGTSSTDWNLVDFDKEVGAIEWTAQWIGQSIVLDDNGVTTLATSQRFGNFEAADLAYVVTPYVDSLRSSAIASCVVRKKNQWRLFGSAGAALFVTFKEGAPIGLMPVSLTNPVTCICSLEAGDGREEIFFGSTNGMVYQMEKGTSQDGMANAWSCDFAYNHFGSPMQLKTFSKAVLEINGSGYASFAVGYSIGYGSSDLPQANTTTLASNLAATQWDSFTWDQFYWDGQTLMPSEVDLDGAAENISLALSGSSDEYEQITFNGAILSFKSRRNKR